MYTFSSPAAEVRERTRLRRWRSSKQPVDAMLFHTSPATVAVADPVEELQHELRLYERDRYVNWKFYSNTYPPLPHADFVDTALGLWWDDFGFLSANRDVFSWLFPTIGSRGVNAHASPLSKPEALLMTKDIFIANRLVRAFRLFLRFIGLELRDEVTGEIGAADSEGLWQRRGRKFASSSSFDAIVVRVIRSLTALGFARYSSGLIDFLKVAIFGDDGPTEYDHGYVRAHTRRKAFQKRGPLAPRARAFKTMWEPASRDNPFGKGAEIPTSVFFDPPPASADPGLADTRPVAATEHGDEMYLDEYSEYTVEDGELEPEPEPIVEAKPEPEPEPEPEPAVEAKPEPKPEPEPEPIVEAKPEPEPEPIVEAKPEPKPEPEPIVEAKPEPKPEPEPVVEAKPEPEPQPVIEATPEKTPDNDELELELELELSPSKDDSLGSLLDNDDDLDLSLGDNVAEVGAGGSDELDLDLGLSDDDDDDLLGLDDDDDDFGLDDLGLDGDDDLDLGDLSLGDDDEFEL
ncbi:opioid growth factor receptor [Thecamonas trahens ATCC 50062]|uniref:Opioid growth factor receptor n=1 Tax=Thecamonas trahens ATCC 50062 TaxID=461836 RepID=A0A0L0DTJ8_THETB|nr:opioid growth factor receptor [Thecamonas trahens ATCC 50062]KNC55560.1 opioid growth factor receptor [Thecamonas trahens ATCC 50062]|eukprot:XP_013761334.1 opioid growth factor receptor [Thecamonas trahens ATCC 50062]